MKKFLKQVLIPQKYKKSENILNKKNVKVTKRAYTFKGYASSYNVEILYSFNPKLQLKDTVSAIKNGFY